MVMSMELIIPSILLICMAWFGITFVYFLAEVRKNSDQKVGSWSLTKDINQLGKIHGKFLAIKKKQSPGAVWPYGGGSRGGGSRGGGSRGRATVSS